MGTEKYVSVSHNRIFEEISSPLLDAVAYAIGANKDIPTELINWFNAPQLVTASDMRAFFSFGKNTLDMLPLLTAKYFEVVGDIDANKQIIADFTGYDITSLSNFSLSTYSSDNRYVVANAKLTQDFKYSPYTNQMDWTLFFAGYLRSVGPITRFNYTDYNLSVSNIEINIEIDTDDSDSSEDSDLWVYVRGERISDGKVHISKFRVPFRFLDRNTLEPIEYSLDKATFERNGTYESVTSFRGTLLNFTVTVGDAGASPLEFYPWIPLIRRFKKVNANNTDPTLYADLTALAKTINIPHAEFVEAMPVVVAEDTLIDDSSILSSIDLCTKNVDALQYLFDYFLNYYPSLSTESPYPNDIKLRPKEINGNLADYFSQFSFEDVRVTSHAGSIPNKNRDGGFNIRYSEKTELRDDAEDSNDTVVVSYSYHIEKDNGNGSYTSIEVIRPEYYTYVVRRRGQAAGQRQLENAIRGNSSECHIRMPLSRNLLEQYTAKEQSSIASYSFGVETGTYTEVDEPWYANSFVQFALQVFAIVVTVLTLDFSGTIFTLVYSAIKLVAINYVVRLLLEEIGLEGFAAVVVTVLVARGGGVRGALGILNKVLTSPTLLLEMTNAAINIINLNTEIEAERLQEDQEEFNDNLRAAQKKIQDYYDSVEGPLEELNPYFEGVATKDVIVIESPTEFFFRTTHVGNVGAQSLDFASSYVDNSLRLDPNNFEESDFIVV